MKKLIAVALVVVAAGAMGVMAVASGGSEGSDEDEVYGVGQVRGTSVAALAQCSDWNDGTEPERQATIEDIHNQVNQANANGPTPDLPADEAYALFERSCAPDYAAGFRLYKLYTRAGVWSKLHD